MYCVYEKEDIVVHEIGVVVLCIVIVVYNVYATTLSAVSIEKSFLCLLTKKKVFFLFLCPYRRIIQRTIPLHTPSHQIHEHKYKGYRHTQAQRSEVKRLSPRYPTNQLEKDEHMIHCLTNVFPSLFWHMKKVQFLQHSLFLSIYLSVARYYFVENAFFPIQFIYFINVLETEKWNFFVRVVCAHDFFFFPQLVNGLILVWWLLAVSCCVMLRFSHTFHFCLNVCSVYTITHVWRMCV